MIVSSPGIERKLKSFRHFELSIGELIKVKLFDPINDVYTFEGDLVSVGEKNIVLKTEITEIEINFLTYVPSTKLLARKNITNVAKRRISKKTLI